MNLLNKGSICINEVFVSDVGSQKKFSTEEQSQESLLSNHFPKSDRESLINMKSGTMGHGRRPPFL